MGIRRTLSTRHCGRVGSAIAAAFVVLAPIQQAQGYTPCGPSCYQSDGSAADTQAAIDAAADGWTVTIPPGEHLWADQVSLQGKAITLSADGAATTTIRSSYGGQWNDAVLSVAESSTGNAVVENLTFVGDTGTADGVLIGL